MAETLSERLRRQPDEGGKPDPNGGYTMGCSCTWGPGPRCTECLRRMDPIRKKAADEIDRLTLALSEANVREASRWIPVGERLPEKDLLVNVMQIDGAIGAGLIMESGSWWCIVPKTDTKDAPITHWQPLPEPPQALTDGGTGG